MKTIYKIGIGVGLVSIIILIAFIANVIKNNRIKEAFSSPKLGQVYILKLGEQYDAYEIKKIDQDSIVFNVATRTSFNGFDYDKMRENKTYFSGGECSISKQQLTKFLNAEYDERGIYDITQK